jgi:hypothetical protein
MKTMPFLGFGTEPHFCTRTIWPPKFWRKNLQNFLQEPYNQTRWEQGHKAVSKICERYFHIVQLYHLGYIIVQ